MSRFIHIEEQFYPQAPELRAVFDERFEDPRSTRGDRFVWDYWHVPQQYTVLRTPAWEYFPEELYTDFHERLVHWGRRQLGCWDISPPWLSNYVDGCQQHLHSDVPHGPWAFVYSLTPEPRAFRGGQTQILKAQVLSYWNQFPQQQDRELGALVDFIEPQFNRLVIFDPRFPHGVTPVHGTHDPREGRLVIHGWFTEPRPFVEGPLETEAVNAVLEPALAELFESLDDFGTIHGLLSLRLTVDADGAVKDVRALADTLVDLDEPYTNEGELTQAFIESMASLKFEAQSEGSELTIPFLFQVDEDGQSED